MNSIIKKQIFKLIQFNTLIKIKYLLLIVFEVLGYYAIK